MQYNVVDHGWAWVIAVGCLGCNACIALLEGVYGLFIEIWCREFKASVAIISLGPSINQAVFLMLGSPLCTLAMKKTGARPLAMLCGIIYPLCIMLLAFARSVPMYLTIMCVMGFAMGCGYPSNYSMLMRYFDRKLSIAAGITALGSKLGLLIIPLLTTVLMKEYTWRGALIILAGLAMHQLLCGAVLIPIDTKGPRKEFDPEIVDEEKVEDNISFRSRVSSFVSVIGRSQLDINDPKQFKKSGSQSSNSSLDSFDDDYDYGIRKMEVKQKETGRRESIDPLMDAEEKGDHDDNDSDSPQTPHLETSIEFCQKLHFKRQDTIYNARFFTFAIVMMILRFTSMLNSLFLVPSARQSGLSVTESAMMMSMLGICSAITCPLAGCVGNFLPRNHIFTVAMFVEGITLIFRPYATNFVYTAIVAAIIGSCYSLLTTMMFPVLYDIVNGKSVSKALGIVLLFQGIGYITGPSIAGLIYDATGSYKIPYMVGGSFYLLGTLLMIVIHLLTKYKKY